MFTGEFPRRRFDCLSDFPERAERSFSADVHFPAALRVETFDVGDTVERACATASLASRVSSRGVCILRNSEKSAGALKRYRRVRVEAIARRLFMLAALA